MAEALENESELEIAHVLCTDIVIYARTGETDEAIKLIEKLLTLPGTLESLKVSNMAHANLK